MAISYKMQPRLQISLFSSYASPFNDSGDIYNGVPTFENASGVSSLNVRPKPKSPTLIDPLSMINILAGFKSRCKTRRSCICAMALQI